MMGDLPEEKVNPQTRNAVLERIHQYNLDKQNDTPFMSVFWKLGGAAIAAGIIALAIVLPSYNKSGGDSQNASVTAGAITDSESEIMPAEKASNATLMQSSESASFYVATNRYSNTMSNQTTTNFRP